MNKTEKMWVGLLVAALIGYLGCQMLQPKSAAPVPAQVAQVAQAPVQAVQQSAAVPAVAAVQAPVVPVVPVVPERLEVLERGKVRVTFSTFGARVVKVELLDYPAENREESPRVVLETGDLLGMRFEGVSGQVAYEVVREGEATLCFKGQLPNGVKVARRVTLERDYVLSVKDSFLSEAGAVVLAPRAFSVGSMVLPKAAGEALGADFLAQGESKPEYCEGRLGKILGAGSAFLGCGTSSDATGLPMVAQEAFNGPQAWVALKSRFFVVLAQPEVAQPAVLTVAREANKTLKVNRVAAEFRYPALQLEAGKPVACETRLYVGPKKLGLLSDFGAHADRVMDFGFFSWVCKLLLPALNMFYALIPNYGVAIILLTLLVRAIFWPLTRKSTIAMRKMSVIQPKLKEIQQKFKDQPQKIQQETFRLYREYQVNPFSSCLPMLVQIPIFIALFVVLRSAVELRFASFLWISDLSQPENLLAGVLPLPLNILPILTAVTMGLQTSMSPSTGDAAQKRMMTWMMPIMLLFMFYSMASALCLYWTVSQVLSIVQTWLIHRSAAKSEAAAKA